MAALGLLFFKILYAPFVDPTAADEYIAGMILLGVAPCTAMVFVWSQLADGDPAYTLVQVSVSGVVMIFAFAPLAALLLGVADVTVPWRTLLLSTALYVVLPLVTGILTRRLLARDAAIDRFAARLKPASVAGLLATVVLPFGFQATTIVANPLIATVVGVLVEVPVMLSLVAFSTRHRHWFANGSNGASAAETLPARPRRVG